MPNGDPVRAARAAYTDATVSYAQAAPAVHACVRCGKRPPGRDIQRELDAKAILEAARQQYLDVLNLTSQPN
jgi:hypothetical protein